jgi:hypothetical protein
MGIIRERSTARRDQKLLGKALYAWLILGKTVDKVLDIVLGETGQFGGQIVVGSARRPLLEKEKNPLEEPVSRHPECSSSHLRMRRLAI